MQQRINPALVELARAKKMPLVATGDVHYLRREDALPHEALLCIQSGDSLKNPNHWRFDSDQFFLKTPEEMALDFVGHEEAMRSTLEVAERCNGRDRARAGSCCRASRRPRGATPSSTSSRSARRA